MRTDTFTNTPADAAEFERTVNYDDGIDDDQPSMADVAGIDRPSRPQSIDETAASLLAMHLGADHPQARVFVRREHILAVTHIDPAVVDVVAAKIATNPAVMDPWASPAVPADVEVVEGVVWVRFHPTTLAPSEVPF